MLKGNSLKPITVAFVQTLSMFGNQAKHTQKTIERFREHFSQYDREMGKP